jgi:2'-5' RNA ligase
MRSFLGFSCGDDLVQKLREVRESIPGDIETRLVAPENYHVTVKFLGDRSREELEDLDRAFQRKLPTPGPFSLGVRGVGAFPDPGNPSVLWAGVETPDELRSFVQTVETISVEHGADREDRDYHAHVTLARVENQDKAGESTVNWIQQQEGRSIGTLEADKLVLYESELQDDGPEYHVMKWWPL